jgi:phosphoketolase
MAHERYYSLKSELASLAPEGERCMGANPHDNGGSLPDMTVLNDLDRFHLVMAVIDRVPKLGYRAAYLRQYMRDKLTLHKQYITKHGQDMPEIVNWKWGQPGGSWITRHATASGTKVVITNVLGDK